MNALQTEFNSLRAEGRKACATLSEMIRWRLDVCSTLLSTSGGGFVSMPRPVFNLVVDLHEEVERLRMTRQVAGCKS